MTSLPPGRLTKAAGSPWPSGRLIRLTPEHVHLFPPPRAGSHRWLGGLHWGEAPMQRSPKASGLLIFRPPPLNSLNRHRPLQSPP